MEERARFPEVAAKAGHYESFYLKACRPDGGQGVWIRHTVHKRPGAEPNGSIWFCLFDREADRAAGDEGDGAGRAAGGSRRRLDPRRRRRDRSRPRRGLGRHRRAQRRLVLHLRRRRRALQVPAGRLALQGAAAEDEVPRAVPGRPLRGSAGGRRRTVRAERLAGDDRPQLGHRARRALGLARGHRLRRRAEHLLRRRRRPRPPRLPGQPLDPLGDAGPRRRAAPARRPRRDPLGPRSRSSRRSAASPCRARTSSSTVASRRRRRTSSAGSTPTRRGPSTTPSTARSPTSS